MIKAKTKISKPKLKSGAKEVILIINKDATIWKEKYKIVSTEQKAINITKEDRYIGAFLDKPMKIGTLYIGENFEMIKVVME